MKKEQLKKVNIKDLPKWSDLHDELMKDPKVAKTYNALDPEYALINAIIDARIKRNISQKMLA